MQQAYIVYTFLLIFLLLSSCIYDKISSMNKNLLLFTSILISSLVLGLRDNVGVDFSNYEHIFTYQYFDEVEGGYALINKIFYYLGFHSCSIFILVAFLQLFMFAKGVESLSSRYLPLAIFFYFTTLYLFLSLNVMRQTLTFSIFVYSIRFIVNKQFIRYVITLLIASTIHKSALVLIPFYFLINNGWLLRHRIVQLAGYFTTFALAPYFLDYIWDHFETLAVLSGYEDYADSITTISEIEWGNKDGAGVYLWMAIDLWVMLFFTKVRTESLTKYDKAFYNLYYMGLLLSNIVAGSYLDRANLYFQNFRIIVYAIFFYTIFKSKNHFVHKVIAVAVMAILIVFFYMGITNKASQCAPFEFVYF